MSSLKQNKKDLFHTQTKNNVLFSLFKVDLF